MTQTIRIWIIDPFEADYLEIYKMAAIPSPQSYYLSRNFYNLGQFPRVTLPSSTKKIDGQFTENGYWEVVMEWNQTYLTVEIDGQSISFQHRFVLDGFFNFYWEPIHNLYYDTAILIKLEDNMVPMLSINPCVLHMRFFQSAKESLLLWNGTALWYSFYDDNRWGTLKLPNFGDRTAASGSWIQEIVLDQKWNLVVKMANNQMFFCKFGVSKLISLPHWVPYYQEGTLYVNQNNEHIYVNLVSNGIELLRYPLQMEVLSAMKGVTLHDCPYVTFEHSMNKQSYYMDKGQEEVFWAQVVYPEGKGVNVKVLKSNVGLLDFHFSNDFDFVHTIFTVNVTFKVKQAKDYTYNYLKQMINSVGMMRVEIVPNLIENRCNLPKERVSYFRVGCPPNRHIRVARPWDMECEMNTFHNYTIPWSVLRTPQADDVVVEYDWNNYGCVFKMHYQSVFKPVLELYDGDTFVKTVDANFIVWETFGRNDYSYNTTMRQAGCLREALTWDAVMQLYPNKPIGDLRGPEFYQSCFILEEGRIGNLTQPYDILNQSSSNHITFSQDDSAVYVFKARIVDPNYSFCDLTTTFAAQTYGITKTKYEYLIPYVTLIFTFITLCILAYSYYRYVYIFRELQMRKKCY
ncbi:cation channel sperm-associated auxiliary subunit epsilon-like [Alosa pseudoharengus]|uniref:cation channel sperm-associated auxiliary subunit epsilon-like n=1 Tax=Alosa pseudoharengus TaxID=34774 RepID=UPI003F8AE5E7